MCVVYRWVAQYQEEPRTKLHVLHYLYSNIKNDCNLILYILLPGYS
jgi:hypothetical protein